VDQRRARAFTSVDDAIARPSLSPIERSSLGDERGELVGLDARAAAGKGQTNWFGVFSIILLLWPAGLAGLLLLLGRPHRRERRCRGSGCGS
jgi:hypothetical protein